MEAWARIANIPTIEARHMPLEELSDAIDAYQIINGIADENTNKIVTDDFIPNLK